MSSSPTADHLEAVLRDLVAEGGDPSRQEFCRELDIPTSVINRHFGTWGRLRERVGLRPRRRPPRSAPSATEIVRELRRLVHEEGPEVTLMRFFAVTGFNAVLIGSRFGSWTALRAAADLPPLTVDPRQRITDEELLDDLHRLWKNLGRFPRRSDLSHQGRYCTDTYTRRLGPHIRDLNRATLRHILAQRIDTTHGPDHPDRESLIEAALAEALRTTPKRRRRHY